MTEQRRVHASHAKGNRKQRRAEARAERRARSRLPPAATTGAALALGLGLHASSARADTFSVTNTGDSGGGSLREAVMLANANPGADFVDVSGISGTILLSSGELRVSDETTITGPGSSALTLDAGGQSRVLFIEPSSRVPVTVSGLKLTKGSSVAGSGIYHSTGDLTLYDVNLTGNSTTGQGAGLFSNGSGSLTIADSVISSNDAIPGAGAGIFVLRLMSGVELTLSDSKITGNVAQQGAGLDVAFVYGSVAIERSTFSGNNAAADGGAVHFQKLGNQADVEIRATTLSNNQAGARGGGLKVDWNDGELRLRNSTLSGNQSASGGGAIAADFGFYYDFQYQSVQSGEGAFTIASSTLVDNSSSGGDAVWVGHGTVALRNTVLADNAGTDIAHDSGGFTFDHCLIENPGAIAISGSGNLVSVDPKLGPLQSNSGPTFTHLPAQESPLIDAGDPSFAPPPPVDQRGLHRVANSIVDIGAVEVQSLAPTISAIGNQTLDEDTPSAAIPFVIDDPDDALSALTLSAISSNGVIPNQNIVFGGSGASRTVTLTPVANASGQTTITVSLGDGPHTTTATFVVTVTAVNDAPAISAVADQSIPEDAATNALAFTLSDIDTALDSLTVSGSSSNPLVVADGGITFGGSGGSRTVTVSPVADASGTATITLTASDGTTPATETFLVTVQPRNDPPTVSSVPDQTTDEDTPLGPIAVTVGDDESAGEVTLSASSSNPSLLTDSGIAIGGNDVSRTLTLTPVANANGTATVTLTVSDGLLTRTSEFDVTFAPVNDPPAFSPIQDQSVDEDASTGPLAFTVSDVDNDASSLQVTADSGNEALVPDSNIVVGGSGANRTVTVTPVPNLSGASTIEISVSDEMAETTGTFEVAVGSANDAPTISPILDQSIDVNGVTESLAFTIGDSETSAASLTVTATSSNQALVPNANIVLAGAGADRTVTVTPAAKQSGVAHITISVSDGTATYVESFAVIVAAEPAAGGSNEPPVGGGPEPQGDGVPTISVIDPVSVDEDDTTSPIAFTLGDSDSNPSNLVVTVTSSNTAIVPDDGIVLSGSGANRSLTITPAENMNGAVLIKLTVSDGTHTTTRTFAVIVNPADDAPAISTIPDQFIQQGESTEKVEFVVSDADGTGTLTLTATSSSSILLPDDAITLGGSGSERTIRLTPVADRFGSSKVTVTLSDGTTSATTTFTLHVSEAPPDERPDAGAMDTDGSADEDRDTDEVDAGEPLQAKESDDCSVTRVKGAEGPPRSLLATLLGMFALGARRRRRQRQ